MASETPRPEGDSDNQGDLQAAVLGALLAAEAEVPSPDGLTGAPLAATSPGPQTLGNDSLAPGAEPKVSGDDNQHVTDPDSPIPRRVRPLVEWALVVLCAVTISLLVRQFLLQPFYIESGSMESTLEVDDRVLVNRLSYKWGDFGRGDVVVFDRLPEEPGTTRALIKRVIGLPGDSVEGRDGVIYIDGVRLDEPYIDIENSQYRDFGPEVVPEGHVFVMGDNRDDSLDSRRFGSVAMDRAAGRAFVTYWPLRRASSL